MKKIFLLTMIIAVISCSETEQKLEHQGKVKYETITVATKIAGRVAEIRVAEGQQVRQGDTLLVLNVPEIEPKLQQTLGAIISAEGQLELALNGATDEQVQQVQGQIDAAAAQVQFARQSFQRMSNMFADSLIPAQQFDEVKSKYAAAQAQLQSLLAKKREIVDGVRPENIKAAKGQLERAKGARNEVIEASKERYLIAPADMIIESIALKTGELATPGYTIINGNASNSIYFRFTEGESNINAFKVNDQVTIKVPYTNKTIKASISSVKQLPRYAENSSTSPNYQLGESIYELKIVPLHMADATSLYNNSTVLLQTK